MKLAHPSLIAKIDAYAISALGISEEALIRRAGEAVAAYVDECVGSKHARILVLCGGGNNGADGYAAALSLLSRGYRVKAVDIFGKGQRSEGGRAVLDAYREVLFEPLSFAEIENERPDVIIDAIFGTGFSGEIKGVASDIAAWVGRTGARVFAVDVPLGVDAALGGVLPSAIRAEATVVLSFMKTGLLSYPAREYCGSLVLRDIGLDTPLVHKAFPELVDAVDDEYVRVHLPCRKEQSHKGSFGRAVLFVGSEKYPGAAALAAEAALRAGVGLLTVASEKGIVRDALSRLPEALYCPHAPFSAWGERETMNALSSVCTANAVLVGCGSGKSEGLCRFIYALLETEGAPLVLDADAINSLAERREESLQRIREARREVLLTPHPLEFCRLFGEDMADVQANRMHACASHAKQYGVSLLLKGARSVIATEDGVFVNTTGSSALAKGGTGDVLAGLVTALLAEGASATEALRIGAYLHGRAAERLAEELSEYGVLPSSLPCQIAKEINSCLKSK